VSERQRRQAADLETYGAWSISRPRRTKADIDAIRSQKGRALAQRFCAECHAVGKRNVNSPNPEAPSFTGVASTPGMTAMALNVFFQTPHRAMPNLILKTDQKNDIIAYMMSLKK
jgi:mono/diheme cytochrome c family protein